MLIVWLGTRADEYAKRVGGDTSTWTMLFGIRVDARCVDDSIKIYCRYDKSTGSISCNEQSRVAFRPPPRSDTIRSRTRLQRATSPH